MPRSTAADLGAAGPLSPGSVPRQLAAGRWPAASDRLGAQRAERSAVRSRRSVGSSRLQRVRGCPSTRAVPPTGGADGVSAAALPTASAGVSAQLGALGAHPRRSGLSSAGASPARGAEDRDSPAVAPPLQPRIRLQRAVRGLFAIVYVRRRAWGVPSRRGGAWGRRQRGVAREGRVAEQRVSARRRRGLPRRGFPRGTYRRR